MTWNEDRERIIAAAELGDATPRVSVDLLVDARNRAFNAEQTAKKVQAELDALKAAHTWIKTSERMPDGSAVMAAKQMLSEVLLLRARLDAMPHDRTWTKETPTPGEYWLSLAPERRSSRFRPVIRCKVFETLFSAPDAQNALAVRLGNSDYRALGESYFTGAQWRLVEETPSDPFVDPPLNNSRDGDLP